MTNILNPMEYTPSKTQLAKTQEFPEKLDKTG